MKLKRGHSYIIVPSPKVACKEKQEFFLSFYMNYDISHVNIERVDEHQRYEFIMEEYEAAMRSVQNWKVKWVKDIIANEEVIRKNDKALSKTQTLNNTDANESTNKSKSGYWSGKSMWTKKKSKK